MRIKSQTPRNTRLLRQGVIHLVVLAGVLIALLATIAWKFFPAYLPASAITDPGRRANLKLLQELSGPARAPEHFHGTWRRPVQVANLDVRRIRLRSDQGAIRIQAWYQCASSSGECDAGEHAAKLEREPSGGIARITLDTAIPEGRIRLTIAPGRDASTPILLLTEAEAGNLPWKTLSNAQIPIERERSGVPLREFTGEWFWPPGAQPGNFAKMVIREAGAGALTVRAWTACESAGLCDLGEQPAVLEQVEGGRVVALKLRYEPDAQTRLDARLYPPLPAGMEVRTVVTKLERHVSAPADRRGRGGFNQASWSHLSGQHVVTRQPPAAAVEPKALAGKTP